MSQIYVDFPLQQDKKLTSLRDLKYKVDNLTSQLALKQETPS